MTETIFRKLNSATIPPVDDDVRSQRAAALVDLDRRRRLSSAEYDVAEAEEKLRYAKRDYTALEVALADAQDRLRAIQDEMAG
ncbi:hypothetical protein [Bradyrhizobium sp. S3.5.5]|uniref:hypothetical protein n=1 Tax=Bradyrhizobium sp. S3.5.5 TaxID=3156430 RepID=UPI0033954C54